MTVDFALVNHTIVEKKTVLVSPLYTPLDKAIAIYKQNSSLNINSEHQNRSINDIVDAPLRLCNELASIRDNLLKKGIFHRDIKPDNFVYSIDDSGAIHPHLIDWDESEFNEKQEPFKIDTGTPFFMCQHSLPPGQEKLSSDDVTKAEQYAFELTKLSLLIQLTSIKTSEITPKEIFLQSVIGNFQFGILGPVHQIASTKKPTEMPQIAENMINQYYDGDIPPDLSNKIAELCENCYNLFFRETTD